MKEKNIFTLKIVFIILLVVALIATLVSCCVTLKKNGNKIVSNDIANYNLETFAVASSDNTYSTINLQDVNADTLYYGFIISDSVKNIITSDNEFLFVISDENYIDTYNIYARYNGSDIRQIVSKYVVSSGSLITNSVIYFAKNNETKLNTFFNADGFYFSDVNNINADFYPYISVITSLGVDTTDLENTISNQNKTIQDLQSKLDTWEELGENFCVYETVYYNVLNLRYQGSSNNINSISPFGDGQLGKTFDTLYINSKEITRNSTLNNIYFKNTFYIYDKNIHNQNYETVTFNGIVDFVEYSVAHYSDTEGYPIFSYGKFFTDFSISFRLKKYNPKTIGNAVTTDNNYKEGYSAGYANGISSAEQSGHIFESSTSFIKNLLNDMGSILNIKIFGNITIGTIIGIPLVLMVVFAILKLVRG